MGREKGGEEEDGGEREISTMTLFLGQNNPIVFFDTKMQFSGTLSTGFQV